MYRVMLSFQRYDDIMCSEMKMVSLFIVCIVKFYMDVKSRIFLYCLYHVIVFEWNSLKCFCGCCHHLITAVVIIKQYCQ